MGKHDSEIIQQWIDAIRSRKGTGEGFLYLFIASTLLAIFIVKTICLDIYKSNNICNTVVFVFIYLAAITLWLIWRRIPQYREDDIGIIFAPYYMDESFPGVISLYQQFQTKILSTNSERTIKCNIMPACHKIKKETDVQRYLAKSNARVIIHGCYTQGKIKGNTIRGFRQISFTVRLRPLQKNEVNPVAQDMAGSLIGRSFCYQENNNFIEEDIVVQNLADVSTFFIALSLTLDNKLEEADAILTRLANKHCGNKKVVSPSFRNAIRTCSLVNLRAMFTKTYDRQLVGHITDRRYDEVAKRCDDILERSKRFGLSLEQYYQNKAIIEFHYGDIKNSQKYLIRAKQRLSGTQLNIVLSRAFLYLWTGEYDKAYLAYNKVTDASDYNHHIIFGVLTFLDSVLNNNPDRVEIRFGLAIVEDNFLDKEMAVKEYKKFIEEAQGKETLRTLIDYSSSRLKTIETAS